jgi:DNA-binding HxlR family transcriptional regulator
VTYSLSRRGHELAPVLDQLDEIAQRWSAENEASAGAKAAE